MKRKTAIISSLLLLAFLLIGCSATNKTLVSTEDAGEERNLNEFKPLPPNDITFPDQDVSDEVLDFFNNK